MRAPRTLLGYILAAAAATLALAGPAVAATAKSCNGSRTLCDRPFNRVVLPATHNSMSAASLGWSIPNQSVDIPTQLRYGIRGLLIDTHYGHPDSSGKIVTDKEKTAESGLYLCHELCEIGATPLVDVLGQISAFLDAHPDNVLLIDQEDYISPADFAEAVSQSGLLRHVYKGATGARWPTLRTMISKGQQVVMLAEHTAGFVPWYHLDYDGIVQETPYNWDKPAQITKRSNWKKSCAPNRGGSKGSLFLMNHWSPPVAPKPSQSKVVNDADTLVGRALACRKRRGLMPTIVAVDMFRSGGLFPAVRKLNALLGAGG
ncbi:MAG: hypothetical protein QOJ07_1034 [Thermoleophilaceae bacterium]|nr:hypothetical protein [Thermoleophilaceae bacterium]